MHPEILRLHKAISKGDLQQVKQLLKQGFDLDQKEGELLTPLQCAVGIGNLEITQALLQSGASVSNQTQWLLERAESKIEILLELLRAGIDPNQRILDDGQTVLMYAAGRGDLHVVKALIEAGADVNIVADNGTFALIRAAEQGYQEVFDYLAPLTSPDLKQEAEDALSRGLTLRQRLNDQFTEDFIEAAAIGNVNTVVDAIKNGVDINALGAEGTTALYIAAYWGHITVVRTLIDAGASLELGRESDGENPLIAASSNALLLSNQESTASIRQLEVIQMLIQAGINVNAKTNEGWNAIEAAANTGNIKAVKLLLQAGADINAKDNWGDTAISRAKQAGHIEIVKLLQDAGAAED